MHKLTTARIPVYLSFTHMRVPRWKERYYSPGAIPVTLTLC